MMICKALRGYRNFAKSIKYGFAGDKGGKKGKDEIEEKTPQED